MASPFIGEIRLFAFSVVPKGWIQCNGSLLSIAQNQALFSILGTTYGGDGRTTFGIPDLRGRVPMSFGQGTGLQNYPQGTKAGTEGVSLTNAQGVAHTHTVMASPAPATTSAPAGNLLAVPVPGTSAYASSGSVAPMSSSEVTTTGGQPHENRQPSLVIAYCMALTGIFPPRS